MTFRYLKNLYSLLLSGILLILFPNLHGQVRINEVLAINATINYDPMFYNYPAWIELHNTSASNLNIGGYYLTDSRTNKTKWAIPAFTTIPANGYLMIWCDNKNISTHSNFDIDADGEGIYLYTNSLTLLDSINLPQQYSNVSFGRAGNGTSWGYMITPTPASSNSASIVSGLLASPTFSQPSGRYAAAISLTISSTISGAQIRYTTDGSEPTPLSAIYSAPLTISQTTVVKAKTYTTFAIPSETVTRTYFIGEHIFTLPIISVSMNPAFLTDNTIGIYVAGTNGISGNCTSDPKNYNRDWGRYCVVEMFNKAGTSEFKKDFETKIYGACSRHFFDQKALAFYPRKKYGKGYLEYPLFASKNIDKYDNFVLRNSGNDFNVTHFRDALMQTIVKDYFDMDWQAFQPAIVYLNGAYWGIMNIREKLNENYIEHNAKFDADSIDFLEKNAEIIQGSNTEYVSFVNQLGIINLWDKNTFGYIDANIDVTNFIQYYIAQIYFGNTDWPGNNIKFWQPKKQGGKWRWIFFDSDFGFALFPDNSNATHATLNYVTDSTTTVGWPNPQWSTLLFRRLIKNPEFRTRFIQQFQTSLNSVFKPEHINGLIDSISNLYYMEMPYHKARWGGNFNDWLFEVQKLKTFARERYNFMPGHIRSFFKLTQPLANIGVSVSLPNSGAITLNNIKFTQNDTIQVFGLLPYTITAEPAAGYKFKQWNIKTQQSETIAAITKGDTWKYHDLGQNLGTTWTQLSYNDGTWLAGRAQLGYGEGDETTTISYGPNVSNKYITAYFRKTITLTDTTNLKSAYLSLLCDDGAVIYINGTEAARYNMPAGTITYTTLASSAATEGVYVSYYINHKLFVPGDNVIAVEIHQNAVNSSDCSFDMDLTLKKITSGTEYTSTTLTITENAENDLFYTAIFEPKPPVSNIFINEIAAKNSTVFDNYGNSDDWFEIYNANPDTVDIQGFFLTDNFKRKNKFQINGNGSSNTKIAPYGHCIFWADEQQHQGFNHTSFKLSGSGERVGIFQVSGTDTLALDTISYLPQFGLTSFIRYPDGSDNWYLTYSLTPNSTNIRTNYPISTPVITNRNNIRIYPNPVYDYINVKFENMSNVTTYQIYNTIGLLVASGKIENNLIHCTSLKPGVYLLTVTNKDIRYNGSFIKK